MKLTVAIKHVAVPLLLATGPANADIVNGFDCGYAGTRYYADADGDGVQDYCRTVGDAPRLQVVCARGIADGRVALDGQYELSAPGRSPRNGNAACPAREGRVVRAGARVGLLDLLLGVDLFGGANPALAASSTVVRC